MKIEIVNKSIDEIEASLEIILVVNKKIKDKKDRKLLKKVGFNKTQDNNYLIASKDKLYVSIDNFKSFNLRTACAKAINSIKKTKYSTIKIAIDKEFRAITEGFILGLYNFDKYKSKKNTQNIISITISCSKDIDINNALLEIKKGQIVAEATNYTRDMVNIPPEDFYPATMEEEAIKLASNYNNLNYKILNIKELKEEKMNALLAVARASRHKPKVIKLSYKPKNPKAIISIVGKGLTYDSGGLSLKPSDFMVSMKSDKSGGCAVLGIIQSVTKMNLDVEVHGFIGAVENMIGGDAYKPDDVLIAKNGKTIEVQNTDAEGRLVLADVLCYAQQEVDADYIFDIATLTGASVVGVGEYTTSVMGNSNKAINKVLKVSQKVSGELATKLDFNPYLKATLKSNIADISNISNTRYGGAITAGLFLSEFIKDKNRDKWVHLDIAGPAFVSSAWGENPSGASGAGVRLMVAMLEKMAK
jgi:leucyl aminopeptidase